MSWNLLILLVFTGSVYSDAPGVPSPIKDVEVSSCYENTCARVDFRSYELDNNFFKCEFVRVRDGTALIQTIRRDRELDFFGMEWNVYFSCDVEGLKKNETYIVRVFAINQKGQSPPSPAVIFSLDPNIGELTPSMLQENIPPAPDRIHVVYLENRVILTWEKVISRENSNWMTSPIEYIIRYGDNNNTSLWNELTTINTWIILDDLMNGTVYSAYLVAKENSFRSRNSYTFPIVIGEDMTGLPEPILTIEPGDKNGVFDSGDPMTIKCTIPPNTSPLVQIFLYVGRYFDWERFGRKKQLVYNTTASKGVYTAKCSVTTRDRSKHSYVSWNVNENVEDGQLRKTAIGVNETSVISNPCGMPGRAYSKSRVVPIAIKNVKVFSDCSSDSSAHVEFESFESDTISYKCEFVRVHDGTTSIGTVIGCIEDPLVGGPNKMSTYFCHVGDLKTNESYSVRVFAINDNGQSPPSPAVIFSLDSNFGTRRLIPHVPENINVAYSLENRVNVTWEKVRMRENYATLKSPIEYIIRYGDNKNMSLWNELTTNNTWITLDDLINGTVYSAYLVSKENNLRSRNSYTFPIVIGEDMTGLPEPILTIEPEDKNGVFDSGDPITIKCTIPPNTYPLASTALLMGKQLETAMFAYKKPLIINTTANADVYTAKCSVFFVPDSRISRHSYGNWTVKKTLDDEHLQKTIIRANETSINLNSAQELISHNNNISTHLAECTRLCYLDPEQVEENFPFHKLKSHYCSHIVLHYYQINFHDVYVTDKARDLLEKIENWTESIIEVSPKLILSLGSKQSTQYWQSLFGTKSNRKRVARKLIDSLLLTAADGIELSWSKESMNQDANKKSLKALINDIKKADKTKDFEIIVAATAKSSYKDFYDYAHLNETASLVVLHSHRLHSNSLPYIGHQTPLRPTSSMKNPNMTWQSLLRHWVLEKKFPRSKIVLSLTASTLPMTPIHNMRNSATFGEPAYVHIDSKNDIHSEEEICASLKSGTGIAEWDDTAEVPFLRQDNQIFAYDNIMSSHIKAVWASMEGVGLALHDIHQGDPNAICNNKTAFPLLDVLSRAQVCRLCLEPHDINECDENDLVVSCHFELIENTPHFELNRVFDPKCTEIVVKQAQFVQGGRITFKDAQQEKVLKKLTDIRPKKWKSGLVISISCGDSEEHLNQILGKDNMTSAIENVWKLMEKYKFSGVQLDCEKAVGRRNHVNFNTFVRKLAEKFEKTKASNGCNRTLSARFSSFTKSPSEYYNISLLNQLFYVSIRMSESENQIDLPFFQNHLDPTSPSTEEFVKLWKNAGLISHRLILELSPYGWKDGKEAGEKVKTWQGDFCSAMNKPENVTHDYLSLTGSMPDKHGNFRFQRIEDFLYKFGYIQREYLGGIAFNSMSGDDYMGFCGRGPFPIINSIYNSEKCSFNGP